MSILTDRTGRIRVVRRSEAYGVCPECSTAVGSGLSRCTVCGTVYDVGGHR